MPLVISSRSFERLASVFVKGFPFFDLFTASPNGVF